MSFYYYKIPEVKREAKVYGNKKVEGKELQEITERLIRPTYSSGLVREQKRLNNYVNNSRRKLPTSCRNRPATVAVASNSNRRLTEKEFSRLIRRLRKPTFSSIVNRVDYEDDDEDLPTRSTSASSRPRTAEERTKSLDDLCRPTTASSYKSFDRMKYAGDNYNKYDYEYVYTSEAAPEEIEFLTDRISRTTIARTRGSAKCPRSPFHSEIHETEFQGKLPLVSGLPKSKSVKEIVGRLYEPSRNGHQTNSRIMAV